MDEYDMTDSAPAIDREIECHIAEQDARINETEIIADRRLELLVILNEARLKGSPKCPACFASPYWKNRQYYDNHADDCRLAKELSDET